MLGDLAFSVRTYHDTAIFFVLLLYFFYCLKVDFCKDKQQVFNRIKSIYKPTKWLFIAFMLYFIYDLITIIYAKNMSHALKKLPYMLEYISICFVGIYYCSTRKRIISVCASIGIVGVAVALGAYIYHIALQNPIYFQRLSTARDYNVFACLMFVSYVFASFLILYELKLSYLKKILIYTALTLFVLPAFYFAGSRRMFIMLPFMLLFVVIYETFRLKKRIAKNLVFVAIPVVVYFCAAALLPAFTEYGLQKEADYKAWVKAQQDSGVTIEKLPNSWNETTIGSMIETIEDKTMGNKRSLIYKTAVNELFEFSPVEWIFGKGGAYDIHLYDITTEQDILEAYSILEYNIRPIGWMSAHNFLLADVLNGGIIKLLLLLFLIAQVIIHLIKAIKIKPHIGSGAAVIVSLVLVNNFISGTYGILNDVFFYIPLMLVVAILSLTREKSTS